MLKLIAICFIILPSYLLSQSITGKVYNQQSAIKNIEIVNISKKIKTLTNKNGDFKIAASIGDSLQIQSIFYKPFYMLVKEIDLKQTYIIELQEQINSLEEVMLSNTKTNAIERSTNNNITLQNQLQEDIKNNPYKYGPPPNNSPDLIKILALVGKLFKKKNNVPIVEIATLEDIKRLFNSSHLFNETLLYKEFKIPKDYTHLFFEYCSVQQIDKNLLDKKHQLPLLDALLNHSKAFLAILKENGISKKD